MIAVNVWNVSHTKHSLTSLTASTERLQQSHVCSCVIGPPSLRRVPIGKPFFPYHSSRCMQDATVGARWPSRETTIARFKNNSLIHSHFWHTRGPARLRL